MEDVRAAAPEPLYRVERPVYDEGFLRSQLLHPRTRTPSTLREKLLRHLRCSSERAKAAAFSFLPILTWLPSYPVRRFLLDDIVSGLSTGVVQLPQGLAYAMLAAVPSVYGLYSSFYPVFLYTFFGTSRHISIGTFAVISLMIGGVVVREAPDSMFYVPMANGSSMAANISAVLDVEARDARRVQLAVALTALVGLFQFVLGILRFGFVAIYLTEPLVRGFTTAAALHVCISQLKYLLGVETQRYSGPLAAVYSVRAVLAEIGSTNLVTFLMGSTCIVFLFGIKELNERFKKKLPVPLPGELLVVVLSTAVSYGLGLAEHHGVGVVGKVPSGLLPPAVPELHLLPDLVADSFAVAIVGFSMGISLAKMFALKHGYSVDGNQELLALGVCNLVGSFFQTFAITCSMSRSLVQESTGGRSQLAGLLASLLVLLVIVAIGFVFEPLPQAVLGSIILVNLLGMFKQVRDIPVLWRSSRTELVVWLASFSASALLGLDYGLLVAVAVAIFTVIYRSQSPRAVILGEVPGSGLYVDVRRYEEAVQCPGVRIFQSNSSIYFANSELYVQALHEKTGVHPSQIQSVHQAETKQNRSSARNPSAAPVGGVSHEVVSWSQQGAQLNGQAAGGGQEGEAGEEVFFLGGQAPIHTLVLDWTPVNFMDSVGVKAIKAVLKEYSAVDVRVLIAGCSRALLDELDSLNFFSGVVTPDVVFPTVHDAVLHARRCRQAPPPVPSPAPIDPHASDV